jgi:hypothetical protein
MRNLFSLSYLIVGGFLGYAAYRSIIRRFGSTPIGRLSAHIVALLSYGLGIGAMMAFYNDGWHRGPGYTYETRSTLPESLVLGAIIGLVAGIFLFFQGERKRKVSPELENGIESEFPADYVAEIVAAEATASVEERQQMAAHVQSRAAKSGQPLPEELIDFVERNSGRLTG